jgi:DNA-binding response OmpR family regulator
LRLEDLELLPREIAEKHVLIPVLIKDDRLFVAMANPRERKVIDELEFVTGKRVYPYVALEGALTRLIEEGYTLHERGERFYVGPRCPPEVLKKHGLSSGAAPFSPSAAAPQAVEVEPSRPSQAPGVVLDDAVHRAPSPEIEDTDFGDTSRELSVVTELPDDAPGSIPAPSDAKSILVVDDEQDIRKLLKRLLSSRGYRVLEADRGLLALRMVKEQAPDLIVLDAMLPEVHGFDIARRIKGSQRYGHIPIIMMSAIYRGWRYAEDLKQSCGVDHYIEKPFRISEVVSAVESCLAGQPAPRRTRADTSGEAERALEAGVAHYKAGRLDEAVEELRRGVGIDPLAYRLHFHLGLLYGKKGQVFDAIRELETAVEINARHFPAVKNLAVLYQKAGFRNKAAETWERALALAPDEPTRHTIRQQLLSLL